MTRTEQLKDAAIVIAPFLCVVGVAVRPGLLSALFMLAAMLVVLACNVRALRATYRRDRIVTQNAHLRNTTATRKD